MNKKAALDRLPPHSEDAEKGVLGCVLLDPPSCMPICIEKLKRGADSFYCENHKTIYFALVGMSDAGKAIDILTLSETLKGMNELENAGGLAYLSSLADSVPSAANLEYYLDILKGYDLRRQVVQLCTEAVREAYETTEEPEKFVADLEGRVLKLNQDISIQCVKPMRTLVLSALNRIEEYHKNQGKPDGISTGFIDFDKMTGGMHGGEMIVIAARPAMGKTSLAMNIAEHVAVDLKLPVGVFSLEMTDESLVLRMVCSRARINMRSIRDGFLAERDFPKLTNAAGKLDKAPLHIDDTGGLSILQLRAKARRMHQQHGIKLFVIDYLQLLNSTNRRADNRQQEIADISSGVKGLAKELNVPVIVLSQLNREMEKDKNRKPRLSDLRESGSIEQDADLVGLLYDPNRGSDDDDEKPVVNADDALPINLLVAKQRNGPTGDVHLMFFKNITRFEAAAKVDETTMKNVGRRPYNED